MPPDIRSFFGGGTPISSTATEPQKKDAKTSSVKKKRGRKVVEDSDDDETPTTQAKKTETTKPQARKEKAQASTEETTSSAYFASSGKAKPAKSTPIRTKAQPADGADTTPSKTRTAKVVAPSPARKSPRNVSAKKYIDSDGEDNAPVLADEREGHDDIHADEFARNGRKAKDDYEQSDSDMSPVKTKGRPGKIPAKKAKASTNLKPEEDVPMPDVDRNGRAPNDKQKRTATRSTTGRKRKSKSVEDDEDDLVEHDELPKKKAKKTPTKSATKAPAKTGEKEESKEIEAILNSIPTVRPPTPPTRDPTKKFQYNTHQNHAPPPSAGSKEPPVGAENCLAGMTFVFTGVLDSLDREEGQSLVKSYGGKITTGPSSKTSYVVLGNDAGPKKLEIIAKLKLKTINEDGLFELIRRLPPNGGDSKAAGKHAEKKEKEEKAIRDAAAEMDRVDREAAKIKAKTAASPGKSVKGATAPRVSQEPKGPTVDSRLWTDKYAPTAISMVCGNKGQVEKLQNWLRKWHNNAKYDFKKAGSDGSGVYRAALIHGPPGIGKTTAAHLVAKLEGFDVVESNASDTRSKKLVEDGLRGVLDTTSLLGYFSGDGKKVEASKRKLVLIMDEVDGMSAGDRGGVGALAAVAKRTSVPMILICNERRLPKMKPFDFVTWDVPFRRPTADMIRARLMTICYREGLKFPAQVLDALIEGSHSDIRQIINMISTAKLDRQSMEFSEGKAMSKAWEKHVILKPWDIVGKILRPTMYGASSTSTLNDKIELYFNDHEFSHLMLEENYLKTTPSAANGYSGKELNLKLLELADKAASSISDGDLVDRMIHGSQQQWSLMPTHAIFSFVRPASYVYGNFTERVGFVSWLGQNSKFGKLSRYIKEIQGHMRLRASGDRHEIRQQYLPLLWQKTVKVLQDEGKEKVPDVIELMDSYFLTKEDYDAMIELGLGPMAEDKVKIDSQAKATFTRMYNAQSHPLPFMKASSVIAPKAAKKVQPDLEDAIDESDVGEDVLAEGEVKEDEDEDIDLKKDKYIKAPKKKPAGKAGGGGGGASGGSKRRKKGKKGAEADGEDDGEDGEESEEVKKPKRGAARGRGKGKGRA